MIIDKCNKLYNLTPEDDRAAMKSYPKGDRRASCLCMGINKINDYDKTTD